MKTFLQPIGQPLVRLDHLVKFFCAILLLAGFACSARASDPNGIYAFIDRVVFEPSESNPERVQIWGGFALAKGRNSYDYNNAERGYLYFKIRPGDEEVCKKEWNDLKAVAGTTQIITFGSRYETPQPTLRKTDAKVENPDVYPKSWGINKVRQRDYAPVNQLQKLMGKTDAPKESPKAPAKKSQ